MPNATALSFQNYIAGQNVAPAAGRSFVSTNPTTGKPYGTFAESGLADVDCAVRAAVEAGNGPWGKLSPTRRGRLMMAWGDKIAVNAEGIARMESEQNGKHRGIGLSTYVEVCGLAPSAVTAYTRVLAATLTTAEPSSAIVGISVDASDANTWTRAPRQPAAIEVPSGEGTSSHT